MAGAPLWSLMRRESRGARGRLTFMTACLALGVAAVTGVAALVGAVEGAVQRDARTLLAADLTIESRRPISENVNGRLSIFKVGEPKRVKAEANVVELGAMVRSELGPEDRKSVV